MRKALIVGINYYRHADPLYGCTNDAQAINQLLERNEDGSKNFDCNLLTSSNENGPVTKTGLTDSIKALFASNDDISLFYFAGHGHIEDQGGYLMASDSIRGNEGVSLNDILVWANNSPSKNKIIILDSCHSGIAGDMQFGENLAAIKEGLTILTASSKEQYASEIDNRGVFTELFLDALSGGSANILGDITPGSIYAHIDQSLSAWEQRPIFKTNVKSFVSLRKTKPKIKVQDLKEIINLFPNPEDQFNLDPTFEPEILGRKEGMPEPIKKNCTQFAILQQLNKLNLVVPIGAPHMWHAAMGSKTCGLTPLGKHYHRLIKKNRI